MTGLYEHCNELVEQIKALTENRDNIVSSIASVTRFLNELELVAYATVADERDTEGKPKYSNEKRRESAVAEYLHNTPQHGVRRGELLTLETSKKLHDRKLDCLQELLKNAQLELRRQGRDSQVVIIKGDLP